MFIGIADARCKSRNNAIQNSPPEYFKMVMFNFSNTMAEDHVHSPTDYQLMEVMQNYDKNHEIEEAHLFISVFSFFLSYCFILSRLVK